MSKANLRRARRAGLIVKECRRGTMYIDPITGESTYEGCRSKKCWRTERVIEVFIRKHERLGII